MEISKIQKIDCPKIQSFHAVLQNMGKWSIRFKTMFERLDGNGNGTLERMELYKASHMDLELAQFVAPRQCGDAFKRMDTHNNGKITFESFLAFCMDVRSSSR